MVSHRVSARRMADLTKYAQYVRAEETSFLKLDVIKYDITLMKALPCQPPTDNTSQIINIMGTKRYIIGCYGIRYELQDEPARKGQQVLQPHPTTLKEPKGINAEFKKSKRPNGHHKRHDNQTAAENRSMGERQVSGQQDQRFAEKRLNPLMKYLRKCKHCGKSFRKKNPISHMNHESRCRKIILVEILD